MSEKIFSSSVRDGGVAETDSLDSGVAEHVDKLVANVAILVILDFKQLLPDLSGETQAAGVPAVPGPGSEDEVEVPDAES